MSEFGKTLFGGSRFIFWVLAPALIGFVLIMTFTTTNWDITRIILTLALNMTAISLLIGLWNPTRFQWVLRLTTAMVFIFGSAYLIDEIFFAKQAVWGSLQFMAEIGIPCLAYTLLRKFTFRNKGNSVPAKNG